MFFFSNYLLLFLIFIHDIVVDLYTNVRLFADTGLYNIVVDTPVNVALKLNSGLLKIHNWFFEIRIFVYI